MYCAAVVKALFVNEHVNRLSALNPMDRPLFDVACPCPKITSAVPMLPRFAHAPTDHDRFASTNLGATVSASLTPFSTAMPCPSGSCGAPKRDTGCAQAETSPIPFAKSSVSTGSRPAYRP